jgi:hypothetical protein
VRRGCQLSSGRVLSERTRLFEPSPYASKMVGHDEV